MEIKDEFKKVKEKIETRRSVTTDRLTKVQKEHEKDVFKLTMAMIKYAISIMNITGDETVSVPFRMPAELLSSTRDEIHRLMEDGVGVVVDDVHNELIVSLVKQHPYW